MLLLVQALRAEFDPVVRDHLVRDALVLRPVRQAIRGNWRCRIEQQWACSVLRHIQQVTDAEKYSQQSDVHLLAADITAFVEQLAA